MARTGSSSKRISFKKKSDKKKKSKRNESKKGHRDYKSDDDSSVSKHSSSSTSQSDYKRRMKKSKKLHHRDFCSSSDFDSLSAHDNVHKSKNHINSQVGSKNRKKKTRKRYSSLDSNADADRVRKRKKLTRVPSVKPKKKSSKKKKSKKHLSSLFNSDSESFSTCQSRSSSSTAEGKDKRTKVKRPNKEMGAEFHKLLKKRKIRSSSCERDDAELAPMNNIRRLKSVIVPAYAPTEEMDRWDTDHHLKEEITYDYVDYLSRSVDSNEVEYKREADNHSHGTSNRRIRVEHVVTEPGKYANNFVNNKKNDKSIPVAALSDANDLELILRQKALENLRKFKVGNQKVPKNFANVNTNNENNDFKGPPPENVDILENKTTKLHSLNTEEVNKRRGLTLDRDFSRFTEIDKHPKGESVVEETGMVKQTVSQPTNEGTPLLGFSEEKSSSNDLCETRAISTNDIGFSTTKPASSGKDSIEKQPNEPNAGSEYEQKTMSVMRGGEMVQVSYKVYIPKRTPALGRRQLRR